MSFPVIPQNLSVSAMRSSGYRDTAHALAELIDNSVQSGIENGRTTQVEVICVERVMDGETRPRIAEIAVLDDAGGMTPTILRAALQFGNGTRLDPTMHTGIGKFGMGLPNSSISQGERVDVWTWREGLTCHSYIDLEEMRQGTMVDVPPPEPSTIPTEWLRLFTNGVAKSGSLVVWSKLDRISWKQSTTLLRHVEFLSGRVYRRFIDGKKVAIRLAAFELDGTNIGSKYESRVRPNDPLYLMTGTSAPQPYDQRPAFDPKGVRHLSVSFRGKPHQVEIRASIAKPELRVPGGGAKPIGKHAKRNQGVSVMRAGRELELNKSFEIADYRERWWGVEVDFPPALDELFGVTNNKQSATAFQRLSLDDDAEAENLRPEAYRQLLELDGDPRIPMYAISAEVDKFIKEMRADVQRMRETEAVSSNAPTLSKKVEESATASVTKRRKRVGSTGRSDKQEEQSDEARTKTLTAGLIEDGVDPQRARDIAVDYVKKHTKFRIRHAPIAGSSLFDVTPDGGLIVITFNTRHAVHSTLFAEFQKTSEVSPLAREVLSLIIAWARMEDEANSPQTVSMYEETREAWGRLAKDFFEADEN